MDPQLGRFWQTDPLATKYVYSSTYAYAENQVTIGIDLEGKELWRMITSLATGNANEFTSAYINTKYETEQAMQATTRLSTGTTDQAGGRAPKEVQTVINNANKANDMAAASGPALEISETTANLASLVPVTEAGTPAIEALTVPGFSPSSSGLVKEGLSEETATIYRGVNEFHPGYDNALKGIALPRGGNATPLEHNTVTTQSEYTSWTYNYEVAVNFALRPDGGGVVLEKTVPISKTVASPNLKSVNLKQSPGTIVSESEALLKGPVSGAKVNWVTPH